MAAAADVTDHVFVALVGKTFRRTQDDRNNLEAAAAGMRSARAPFGNFRDGVGLGLLGSVCFAPVVAWGQVLRKMKRGRGTWVHMFLRPTWRWQF